MKSITRILLLFVFAAVFAAISGCYNTCTLKARSERRDGASFTAGINGYRALAAKN